MSPSFSPHRRLWCAFISTCAVSVPAFGQPSFMSGRQKAANTLYLLAEGGDQRAIEQLRRAAEQGDSWSALQYGYILHLGIGGVQVDKAGAFAAYQIASPSSENALGGLKVAAYNQGLMYLWGETTDKQIDIGSAIKWLRVAGLAESSEDGCTLPAAMQLAVIYENGFGKQPQNLPEAARWYSVAAKFGDPVAMYKHGRIQIEGEYASRSPAVGVQMLQKASERGSADAMYYLAALYARGASFLQQSDYYAAYWVIVASLSKTGKRDPAYTQAVTDAEARLKGGSLASVRKEAQRFSQMHSARAARVKYNTPLNAAVQFY